MRGLNNLHPKVMEKAMLLQKLAQERLNLKIIFTDTLRTDSEQQAYYAQGRLLLSQVNGLRHAAGMQPITEKQNKSTVTKAKNASFSWHGYGLAFDIAVEDQTGKHIIWDKTSDWNADGKDDWVQVGALADEIGLEWGGNFSGLYDAPHYQDRMGLTLAAAQSKFKSGQIAQV